MNSQILFVIMIVTACGLATDAVDSAIISTISAQDNTTKSIIGNLTGENMISSNSNITEGIVVTGGEGGNDSGTGLQ